MPHKAQIGMTLPGRLCVGTFLRVTTAKKNDLPILSFQSQRDLEAWLEANNTTSAGIWLKLARKTTGKASITRSDLVDSLLCFGWIDGQAKSLDDQHWLQRLTPRGPRSKWSQINCKRAEELIAQGRIKPVGLAAVEAAKKNGQWEKAYASPKKMTVPPDLQERLDANPKAKAFFSELDSRNRYAILYRIHDAKKEDTRARRIEQFVEMLSARETIY